MARRGTVFSLDCSNPIEDQLSFWTGQESTSFPSGSSGEDHLTLSAGQERTIAFPLNWSGEHQLSLWIGQERTTLPSRLSGQHQLSLWTSPERTSFPSGLVWRGRAFPLDRSREDHLFSLDGEERTSFPFDWSGEDQLPRGLVGRGPDFPLDWPGKDQLFLLAGLEKRTSFPYGLFRRGLAFL
jgi:hypothetical protein